MILLITFTVWQELVNPDNNYVKDNKVTIEVCIKSDMTTNGISGKHLQDIYILCSPGT